MRACESEGANGPANQDCQTPMIIAVSDRPTGRLADPKRGEEPGPLDPRAGGLGYLAHDVATLWLS